MRLDRGDAPLARALALAALALLPAVVWWLRRDPGLLTRLAGPCRLQTLLDLPCPTCGGTRAAALLARGDLPGALAAQPAVALALVSVAAWTLGGLVVTLVPRWRRRLVLAPGDRRRLAIAAGAVVLAGWAWVLAVGGG